MGLGDGWAAAGRGAGAARPIDLAAGALADITLDDDGLDGCDLATGRDAAAFGAGFGAGFDDLAGADRAGAGFFAADFTGALAAGFFVATGLAVAFFAATLAGAAFFCAVLAGADFFAAGFAAGFADFLAVLATFLTGFFNATSNGSLEFP